MGKVSDSELREVGENPREIYNSGNGDYTSKNTELISFRNEREVLDLIKDREAITYSFTIKNK